MNLASTENPTDVLIAGAGPVGLSLAAALIKRGLSVVVVEAAAELSHEARASTIHPPTLEMFAEWGFVNEVLAKGRVIDRLQFWERRTRELIAEFDYARLADDTPYPYRFQCPQSTVTRCILPLLQRHELAQVYFEHELIGFNDDGARVTARVSTPAGEREFNARYLIGCDGSRSRVRTELKLGFSGKTYEDRFLLFATDLDMQPFFPGMGPVAYLFDPEEWAIVMQLPAITRLVFRLRDDEDAMEAQRENNVRQRIAGLLGETIDCAVNGVWVYHIHQRVTASFRAGRVLLAGDAAHINNPTGGMGMNSGIHDAWFLANALEAALREGDDEQLDRYAEQRRRAATEAVQQMSDANYNNLIISDPAARAARNEDLRATAADPDKARQFLRRQAMLEDWLVRRNTRRLSS